MLASLLARALSVFVLFGAPGTSADLFHPVRMGLPTVTLDQATVVGVTNNSVTSFRGIPFAEPP